MRRFILISTLAACLSLPAASGAATLYTSPTGSGTACTQVSPCSPAALFDTTSGAPPARIPAPGDTVELAAGEYNFNGRYFEITTDNLTIQGPSGVRDASTHVAFLDFGSPGAGFAAPNRGVFVRSANVTLRNLTFSGDRPVALLGLNNDTTALGATLDRVMVSNTSNASGVAFAGNAVAVTNSVFRYDGTNPSGRALEITGTLTGSLVYSSNGQAISVKGNLHTDPYCSLVVKNTIAWGGARSLDLNDNDSLPGDCTSVATSYQNSWIPNPGAPSPQLGGGISTSGASATVTAGAGNLPDTPAVFDPSAPGSTYLSNYELPADSPAVDAGCTAGCGTVDFYSRPRPIGSANDIGPYEATLKPALSGVSASLITASTARLSGVVNPNFGATTYNFLIRRVGQSDWEAVSGANIAAGSNSPQAVTAEANLLQPDTAYEARLTATNSAGTQNLDGASFRTLAGPSPGPGPSPDPSPTVSVSAVKSKVTKKGAYITSKVTVSGAGKISQRATTGKASKLKSWCKASRTVTAAGAYTLKCNLGTKGRKYLKKKSLRLTLRAGFTPSGGSAIFANKNLTIKRKH